MDSKKRIALLVVGLFFATVVVVLLVLRGGSLFAPREQATELPLVACDLQKGPCSAALPEGGRVTLAFEPRPVRPMQDFTVRLTSEEAGVQRALVSFTGVDMNMGLNRFALKPDDSGFSGTAILPICVRNRMEWEARLRLDTPAGLFEIPFRFATYKRSYSAHL